MDHLHKNLCLRVCFSGAPLGGISLVSVMAHHFPAGSGLPLCDVLQFTPLGVILSPWHSLPAGGTAE